MLELKNADKFVRPKIIRPFIENYTNLLLGLGVYINQNLIFALPSTWVYRTSPEPRLDSPGVRKFAITACARLRGIRVSVPGFPYIRQISVRELKNPHEHVRSQVVGPFVNGHGDLPFGIGINLFNNLFLSVVFQDRLAAFHDHIRLRIPEGDDLAIAPKRLRFGTPRNEHRQRPN